MPLEKGMTDQKRSTHPLLTGVMQYCGEGEAGDFSFGIVVSRFNRDLTESLLVEAVATLKEAGVESDQIEVVWVPGAFEIPTALEWMATKRDHTALIALGAVVQGATPHAEAINREVIHAQVDIARRYSKPVVDGVVVADTVELAAERCLGPTHNRGAQAARAALEMALCREAFIGDG